MAPAEADAVHEAVHDSRDVVVDAVPLAPAQIVLDGAIADLHAGADDLVGDLSNLIRELDEALQQMTTERPMSPQSSCCMSLGSGDLEISVFQHWDDCCDDEVVNSGMMAEDDIQIFCCGMFRSTTEACVCTTS